MMLRTSLSAATRSLLGTTRAYHEKVLLFYFVLFLIYLFFLSLLFAFSPFALSLPFLIFQKFQFLFFFLISFSFFTCCERQS